MVIAQASMQEKLTEMQSKYNESEQMVQEIKNLKQNNNKINADIGNFKQELLNRIARLKGEKRRKSIQKS